MTTRETGEDCRLGFLAAIEIPERGYIGGLLVTNRFGRPLEFQCTTPVKPNRTQEILYGPTLAPFVLGELIGRTLLEKVGVKPHFVLTENQDVLEVRKHVGLPVACLEANRNDEADDSEVVEQRKLRFHAAHDTDRTEIEGRLATLPREIDLREPFERVREALAETTRSGTPR